MNIRSTTTALTITAMLCLTIGMAGRTHADSATLKQLVDGATLETDGFTFFDFTYSPSTGAPQASDINVQMVSHGLQFSFSGPLLADIDQEIIEFDIDFYASAGPGQLFNESTLSSGISTTGNGEIGLGGVIATESLSFLADLENSASESVIASFDSAAFSPTGEIFVTMGFALSGSEIGTATLSDFTQTFMAVPTPSAAALGLMWMGALLMRRQRSKIRCS